MSAQFPFSKNKTFLASAGGGALCRGGGGIDNIPGPAKDRPAEPPALGPNHKRSPQEQPVLARKGTPRARRAQHAPGTSPLRAAFVWLLPFETVSPPPPAAPGKRTAASDLAELA